MCSAMDNQGGQDKISPNILSKGKMMNQNFFRHSIDQVAISYNIASQQQDVMKICSMTL